MFELDPKLSALDAASSAILEIYLSLNTAEVATKEFVGEPAKAYICLISPAPERCTLFVNFFFPNKNRAIFYPYHNNPFTPASIDEVKDEAMIFLESFGFIMEQVVGKNSTLKDKEHWMARVPFFKMGGPTGEIILRCSANSFPADGTSQFVVSSDLIRDTKGEVVANGTKIRVGTNLGLLGTLEEQPQQRQLLLSTIEGMITFLFKAPAKAGKAVITAASEEGSAVGELTIDFTSPDPAGDIELIAIPPKAYADGETLVTIRSELIQDSSGNTVVDGTLFSIEISDQERVLSSIQATSQKGIIRHELTAPSTPTTFLVTAKSQKGQAHGELVVTFEAPLPVIEEELPPAAIAPEELPSPEAAPGQVFVPEAPSEAKVAPFLPDEESAPVIIFEEKPSPVLPSVIIEESGREPVFQKEEVDSAFMVALEEIPVTLSAPVLTEAVEEKDSLPPTAKEGLSAAIPKEAAAEETVGPAEASGPGPVFKGTRPLEPSAEKPAAGLPSGKLSFPEGTSLSGEQYKELIRFLTHM